jgi:hypothetical protein
MEMQQTLERHTMARHVKLRCKESHQQTVAASKRLPVTAYLPVA